MHSILKEIVAQLIQQGLAPDTARRCADLFDEVEWHNAQLPLRQWLESIRDFYHKKALREGRKPPADAYLRTMTRVRQIERWLLVSATISGTAGS